AGISIGNVSYRRCSRYIAQRALGADLTTAGKGILCAGWLKLFMPIIVMLPGIAAYVLYKNGALQEEMAPGGVLHADNAYSAILGRSEERRVWNMCIISRWANNYITLCSYFIA